VGVSSENEREIVPSFRGKKVTQQCIGQFSRSGAVSSAQTLGANIMCLRLTTLRRIFHLLINMHGYWSWLLSVAMAAFPLLSRMGQ